MNFDEYWEYDGLRCFRERQGSTPLFESSMRRLRRILLEVELTRRRETYAHQPLLSS